MGLNNFGIIMYWWEKATCGKKGALVLVARVSPWRSMGRKANHKPLLNMIHEKSDRPERILGIKAMRRKANEKKSSALEI